MCGRRGRDGCFADEPAAAEPGGMAWLGVSEPAYMHSFALTDRWLVLAEFPFVGNPLALALSGRPYIENYPWKPERGTRFTLVDRATGRAATTSAGVACSPFHNANASET